MNNIQLALTLIDYLIDKHAGTIDPALVSTTAASPENNPWESLDLDASQFGQESFQAGTPSVPASTQPDFIPQKEPPQTPQHLDQADNFISTAKETLPLKSSVEPDQSPPAHRPDKIDSQPGEFNDFNFDF
ncbi:hypothetical protein [Microscilla marina]|uniref:Uncharacterized protein n=1 Tax=Microscilla marina ATCC 23134 TaxID=313606 RepID=A1ZF71_MICM2|nr:hypothetical protein [Microscilla marina]EAY31173.1 conserved hypothetical protein [Microscilla marina ATCC 23134]